MVEALIRFADDPTATLNTNWDCTFTATYLGATHANIAKVVSDKQTTDDILIDVVPFVDDITLYKEKFILRIFDLYCINAYSSYKF